jgi:PcfJ-like protein
MSNAAIRFTNHRFVVAERAAWAEASAHCTDVAAGRAAVAAKARVAGLTVGEYLGQRADRWFAKVRSRAVGLAYWPAVARGAPRIDATAFAVAEQVMAARDKAPLWGTREGETMNHGGWDSQGFYGLTARRVAAMWYVAGCRDGGKFRLQVFHGETVRKGDSLPFARNLLRGMRWLAAASNSRGLHLARKAVAALGRLSPELRAAALAGVVQRPDVRMSKPGYYPGSAVSEWVKTPVRVRDLNWPEVARVEGLLASGGERIRAALSSVRRAAGILGVEAMEAAVAVALLPGYPTVGIEIARRVVLGETLVQISGGVLTKAEAHAWACNGCPADVAAWLAAREGVPAHRSVRVVRWLAHCRKAGRWASIERVRIARTPGQDRVHQFTVLSVLDEVQDADIITGRDSAEDVLQRSAARLGDAWMSEQMADHRLLCDTPTWAATLPRGMRLLRTPAELAAEGRQMRHCVGGYRDAVSSGQCWIIAISTRHGRSTVELTAGMAVAQHRAENNGTPPQRNESLLRAWINRVTETRTHRRAA